MRTKSILMKGVVVVSMLAVVLASPSVALATIIYGFESPSTGFQGEITIDNTHPSFTPGGTVSVGGAITDFSFTFFEPDPAQLNTYTPVDLEVVALALTFSAFDTGPNDIVFATGSYRDLAPPQGSNIRFEFGGIDSGGSPGPNGLFTGASTGTLSFSDGTFSVVPEPSSFFLIGSGLVGLLSFRRRLKR